MGDEKVPESDEAEGSLGPEDMAPAQPVPEDTTEETPTLSDAEDSTLTRTAKEVINGGWSQGQERRKLLSDAGHDPDEVEAEVTRLRNES